MDLHRRVSSFYFLALMFLLTPLSAFGVTVTNANDSGPGSLRQTVMDAPSGGTVDFDPSLAGSTITFQSLIFIDKDVTIKGPGARLLTLSGGNATGLFLIIGPATFFGISDLTITRGNGVDTFGGAIGIIGNIDMEINRCVFDSNGVVLSTPQGGAIYIVPDTGDNVIINDSTFSGNFVEGESLAFAGAVFIGGPGTNLEINRCTFNNNRAVTANEGAALGGAIAGLASGIRVTVTNSTFSGNGALCGNDCISGGGAISFNNNVTGEGSSLALNNDTFSGNSASCGSNCKAVGNTIAVDNNPRVTLYSSIMTSGPGSGNCGDMKGPVNIASLRYNITDDDTCINGSASGDRQNTDPGLDPAGLRNNGGPTETIAISRSSAAFDTGDPACPPPSTDQKGVGRPQAASCDVGAYELILRDVPALSECGMITAALGLGLTGVLFALGKRSRAGA